MRISNDYFIKKNVVGLESNMHVQYIFLKREISKIIPGHACSTHSQEQHLQGLISMLNMHIPSAFRDLL